MILLSITILVLTGSHPLNAIDFVFCTDMVKPYSVIMQFNLCTAFCKLSSVSAITTWSSANNKVDSCWFFKSLIPVMSCFCHSVIMSSKYILNSVGESGQPWRTPLLISAGCDSLLFNFINILFCVESQIHCDSNSVHKNISLRTARKAVLTRITVLVEKFVFAEA